MRNCAAARVSVAMLPVVATVKVDICCDQLTQEFALCLVEDGYFQMHFDLEMKLLSTQFSDHKMMPKMTLPQNPLKKVMYLPQKLLWKVNVDSWLYECPNPPEPLSDTCEVTVVEKHFRK